MCAEEIEMPKCKRCGHERECHIRMGEEEHCFWRIHGAVRGCLCDRFVFPDFPEGVSLKKAERLACENAFCLHPGSILSIKTAENSGVPYFGLVATIFVETGVDINRWVRENFPWGRYGERA